MAAQITAPRLSGMFSSSATATKMAIHWSTVSRARGANFDRMKLTGRW
uniref:Uncharacterized protein n=1 Tax=Mycolicibacterium phage phi1_186018 TaxID=3236641 RepID=A0AB39AKJ5_9CAUD